MKPRIENTGFGWIKVNSVKYTYDIIITLNGEIKKRKKKLSKKIYGTSHTLSLDEAAYISDKNCKNIIIGSGQYGVLELSDKATEYFKNNGIHVILESTPKAINTWNTIQEKACAMFHVTC